MAEIEVSSTGGAGDQEAAVILRALEAQIEAEKAGQKRSQWKLYARAIANRLGAADSRMSFGGNSWRASSELPWEGTVGSDLRGRGDAK